MRNMKSMTPFAGDMRFILRPAAAAGPTQPGRCPPGSGAVIRSPATTYRGSHGPWPPTPTPTLQTSTMAMGIENLIFFQENSLLDIWNL